MSDDLLNKLHDLGDQVSEIEYVSAQMVVELGKFRAALLEIEGVAKFYTVRKNTAADAMRNIARAALAGEKKNGPHE